MQPIPFPRIANGGAFRRLALVPTARSGSNDCRLALAIAAAAFDIDPEEMRAASRRSAPVAEARHVAIYLAHVVFQATMQVVADAFGRDRTSVGHAVRRVEDRRDDPAFDRRMDRLEWLARSCRADGSAREEER